MNQSAITIRVETTLKKNFETLCEEFGLSVTAAINIFMKAVVRERKIPFEIQSQNREEIGKKGLEALREMQRIVAESDEPEMSLEEINDFIKKVRDEVSR